MSLFSVQARKHTVYYDNLLSAGRAITRNETLKDSMNSVSLDSVINEDTSKTSERSRQVNKTYVVSAALSKSGNGHQQSPYYHSRLTLQRRSRRKTGSERTLLADNQSSTPAVEKRLTLQRRTRTPSSMDKSVNRGARLSTHTPASQVLGEANGRTASLLRSVSLRETAKQRKKKWEPFRKSD